MKLAKIDIIGGELEGEQAILKVVGIQLDVVDVDEQ